MMFDEMDEIEGATFEIYEATAVILPSIFLIDQTGMINIRSDAVATPGPFEEEMNNILTTIDYLLAHPPGGF